MDETPDTDHLDTLRSGADAWNAWRAANLDVRPLLCGVDLSDIDLAGANLGDADLADADFCQANLKNANLKLANLAGADMSNAKLTGAALYKADLSAACLMEADLSDADLREAKLTDADLRGSRLRGANLTETNLSSANLGEADLAGAILAEADITQTNMSHANLASVNMIGMRYGGFRSMRGHCHGIRGLDSCFGNALFVRDAKDQDYLDTLESAIANTAQPLHRKWKRFWFAAWGLIDYGRSLVRTALYALMLSVAFGLFYFLDMLCGWGFIDLSSSSQSWLSPFYFSVVTYTTLGFGDITPKHWFGEIVVISEVVLGYTTLGLLLSILANKVARRS